MNKLEKENMSAVLEINDIQPVAELLERLQNVQRAIRDLHDGYNDARDGDKFYVSISQKFGVRDVLISNTHALSYWIVLQGLAAMERELLSKLSAMGIDVASALPMQESRRASIPDPFN